MTAYFAQATIRNGFGDVSSIYLEMIRMHAEIKKNYFLTPQQHEDIFESSEWLLLFIHPNGIFEVDWMRNVREYTHMAAIGTGDEYTLGAMRVRYPFEKDPQVIVQKGLEAAAHFDKKTALPAHYFSIQ